MTRKSSSYTSLLVEIQKAVKSCKIKLKDSERTIHYMEIILKKLLPEHQHKIKSINVILNALHENKNGLVVNKSKGLKDDIRNCSNKLGKVP